MVEPREADRITDESLEKIKSLAREAQRALAAIGPHIIIDLAQKLDAAVDERDKAKAMLSALAMATRNLLNRARTDGIGMGDDKNKEIDSHLFHEVDVALMNIDAVNRYGRRQSKPIDPSSGT